MKTTVEKIEIAVGESALGPVLVAKSDKGLCAIALSEDRRDQRRCLERRFPGAEICEGGAGLSALLAKVIRFVESPRYGLDAALDLRGTEFQCRVWQALREIPAGTTSTYTDIAIKIGRPRAVRAVAAACAANTLAVVVPCHRVLRRDGDLSGYRWGVERKRSLLERER